MWLTETIGLLHLLRRKEGKCLKKVEMLSTHFWLCSYSLFFWWKEEVPKATGWESRELSNKHSFKKRKWNVQKMEMRIHNQRQILMRNRSLRKKEESHKFKYNNKKVTLISVLTVRQQKRVLEVLLRTMIHGTAMTKRGKQNYLIIIWPSVVNFNREDGLLTKKSPRDENNCWKNNSRF